MSNTSNKWQPIETAPKDGTELIGWNGVERTAISWVDRPDDDGDFGWCGSSFVKGGFLYTVNNILSPPPTHWMPFPGEPS